MSCQLVPYRTGKIAVLADLHIDHYTRRNLNPFVVHQLNLLIEWSSLDALIIAGDLVDRWRSNWTAALAFLTRFVAPTKLYIIPGNHDFYGHHLDEECALQAMVEEAGAHFIQMAELHHGTSRIFCCTLWTDFDLLRTQAESMDLAERTMLDYAAITKMDPATSLLNADFVSRRRKIGIEPSDIIEIHQRHRDWLDVSLGQPHFAGALGKTVVVTHHGPHPITAGPITDVSPAFHSNLEDLIMRQGPEIWLFGHSHRRFRGKVGNTDIRNIAIGYPDELRIKGELPLEDMCMLVSDPFQSQSF